MMRRQHSPHFSVSGSAYFLSASVTFLTFLLSLVAWWRLRGKDISDLGGVQRQASYKDWREERL